MILLHLFTIHNITCMHAHTVCTCTCKSIHMHNIHYRTCQYFSPSIRLPPSSLVLTLDLNKMKHERHIDMLLPQCARSPVAVPGSVRHGDARWCSPVAAENRVRERRGDIKVGKRDEGKEGIEVCQPAGGIVSIMFRCIVAT